MVLDPSKRPTLDEILNDPFMSSDPIPKTIPRSTLACPPAKNFAEQYKAPSTTNLKNSINTNSNNRNDDSRDKIINKNES